MIATLVTLVVYLLCIGLLIALVWYVLDSIPVPDPFNRMIKLVVVVICCLILILLLLSMVGGGAGINLPKLG